MKRKIIALCLIVAMLGVAVIGGTMAYFTDTAEAVNVMTIGSVKIEQHEQQRNGTALEAFEQAKPLLPAVGKVEKYIDLTGAETDSHKSAYKFLATADLKALPNAIDKIVTVENTGRSDAFVRTIFAFEVVESAAEVYGDNEAAKTIKFMRNDGKNTDTNDATPGNSDWIWEWFSEVVTIDGQKYALAVATHEAALAPKTETIPSLLQIYMKSDVEQEYAVKLGDTYDVLVYTQAVQASGFADAKTALNEAFGAITTTNHPWVDGVVIPVVVSNAEELKNALESAPAGSTTAITLDRDVAGDMEVTQKAGVKVVLDGNGYTFDGDIIVNGGSSTSNNDAGIVIQNMKFYAAKASDVDGDAFIKLGESGNNNTRYTKNVTISNCTFDVGVKDKDLVAIKSYTGGDKNLTVENCTVSSNMHSLMQVKNVHEKLTVIGCTINSKNGINVNSTGNVEIIDCTFNVQGYAFRAGVNGTVAGEGKVFTLKNCTMNSACAESGDAVIEIRDDASKGTLILDGTTLTGTTEIKGATADTTIIKK